MCVIIYKPRGAFLDKAELRRAWDTNPDGGGYSVTRDGTTYYAKGFLTFKQYYKAVKPYLSTEYDLVLHLRITSRGTTTERQTHPFKRGGTARYDTAEGVTREPLYYMNGTIYGLTLTRGLNDTETLLKRYGAGLSTNNLSVLVNMLEVLTDSLWLVHSHIGDVYYSSRFIEEDGVYYSNLNHKYVLDYSNGYYIEDYSDVCGVGYQVTASDLLSPKLLKQIRRNKRLYNRLLDFIARNCHMWLCDGCTYCLSDAQDVDDVKELI